MTSAKLIPAVSAVYETIQREVQPKQEAKVMLELSLHEAHLIQALLGRCNDSLLTAPYSGLCRVLQPEEGYCELIERSLSKNIYPGVIDFTCIKTGLEALKKQVEAKYGA